MTRPLLDLIATVAALGACGDNEPTFEVLEPTSGTRLAIEQYLFTDGTRLPQPTAFYDRRIHARCTPQEWIDGVVRCVPDAEEAFYRETTCETLFGRATMKFPTHFIARDTRASDGARGLARAFEVGAKADPIEQYFLRVGQAEDGTPICTGPFTFPPPEEGTQFYELAGEVGGEDLVPIIDDELGAGRLGLAVRRSADGALVPLGFRDRELGVACAPTARENESGACVPIDASPAPYFADPGCTAPALLVPADAAPPAVARSDDGDGCPAYHTVAAAPAPRAYVATNSGCASVQTSLRVFPLGPIADLAPVTRTVDAAPKRRLQRILASEADLHVYGDRLYDTATRAECELRLVGDTQRCLPTVLAPVVDAYQPGCTIARPLAEVPDRACVQARFAATLAETPTLHAIGEPFTGRAYVIDVFGTCTPYVPTTGTTPHLVGPALPEDTFVAATPYGAR